MTNRKPWRRSPLLQGRFHPEYPDDIQVMVHDGGPRITPIPAEIVWVQVTAMDSGVFRGIVLNKPFELKTVQRGQEIQFVVAAGAEYPILVTDKYLAERPRWMIAPCMKCGFSELFDAPSDLIRAIFPNLPQKGVTEMFTTFCPLCGGVQGLVLRGISTFLH